MLKHLRYLKKKASNHSEINLKEWSQPYISQFHNLSIRQSTDGLYLV